MSDKDIEKRVTTRTSRMFRADLKEQPEGSIIVTLYKQDDGEVAVGVRVFRAYGEDAIEDRNSRIDMAQAWALSRIRQLADGLYDHSISIEVAM